MNISNNVVTPARQVPETVQLRSSLISLFCLVEREQGLNSDLRRALLSQNTRLFSG